MTTQINDIHDLLRLLEERPDLAVELRQRTLTPELLAMPEQMAQLTAQVEGLSRELREFVQEQREINRRTDERLARLEELQAQGNERLARLEELQAQGNERLARLEELQMQGNERLTRLEELQAQGNERLTRLEELQAQGNERLARLEELQAQGNERLRRVENRVGDLSGSSYELLCLRRIPSLVFNQFGLVNTAVLYGGFNPPEQQFQGRLLAARREGKISDDDFRQLMAADCLAYAWDAEAEAARYLAVEMSVTLDRGDIERARERAAALGRVTEGSGQGVVISANVAEPQGRQARDAGVTVIHFTGDR